MVSPILNPTPKISPMAKNPQEYEFWIVTTGNGMCAKGTMVGDIKTKTKSTDMESIFDKLYENLGTQVKSEETARKYFTFVEKTP